VLVERLIVHRPHPWGLLITFIELIKNPRYNFWCAAPCHAAPRRALPAAAAARPAAARPTALGAPPPHPFRTPHSPSSLPNRSKGFTRCAPEIERLFESVARSCMATNTTPCASAPGAVGGAAED
jgi:hypothetical protein